MISQKLKIPSNDIVNTIQTKQIYLVADKRDIENNAENIEFIPYGRKDISSYFITFPFDWSIDPFNDRNWQAQLHMWRMIDYHLIEYESTKDVQWLAAPLKIISEWHNYHIKEKHDSTYAWQDMMAGIRAMKIAFIASQWQSGHLKLSDSLLQSFEELVEAHLDFLLDEKNIKYYNHTFFDLQGAAALAQVVDEKTRLAIYEVIDKVLPRLIAAQFNDFGVHLENSPEYHLFGINRLKQLQDTGWFDDKGIKSIITKATDFYDWFKMPDGRILPIGDSNGSAQNVAVKKTAFIGKNQVLNNSGYAIIRSDGNGKLAKSSYLSLMGALNSRFHKQSDDLSVIWFEGEDILCDTGKYAYKTDDFRAYAISTRAHNTVEIDGKDYYNGNNISPELIYGSAIGAVAVHDWGYLLDASVHHVNFGVRHARFLAYRPGAWLLVIDRLIGEQLHDFTQWFHLAPHLPDPGKREGGYYTRLRSGKRLRVCSVGGDVVTAALEKGVTQPRVQGWISQKYGQMTPNCALGYRQRGKNVLFATLLTLNDQGSTIQLQNPQRLELTTTMNGKTEKFRISVGEHSCRVRTLY